MALALYVAPSDFQLVCDTIYKNLRFSSCSLSYTSYSATTLPHGDNQLVSREARHSIVGVDFNLESSKEVVRYYGIIRFFLTIDPYHCEPCTVAYVDYFRRLSMANNTVVWRQSDPREVSVRVVPVHKIATRAALLPSDTREHWIVVDAFEPIVPP